MKRLSIRQRIVADARVARYDAAWASLAGAIRTVGGHAWRFRGEAPLLNGDVRSIEFIELDGDAAHLEDARVIADALAAIEIVATTEAESTWEEWPA